jgi:hypothetical protein
MEDQLGPFCPWWLSGLNLIAFLDSVNILKLWIHHKKGLMVESLCMKSVDSSELTVDILEEDSY